MRLFPGLNRDLALLLVSATKETRGATNDPSADQFAQVLVKCRSTSRELNDAMVFCQDSPYGLKCFRTAVGYYLKDPVAKGHRDLAEMLLLRGLEKQVTAEAEGEEYSDDQVQQDIETEADRMQEMLRLRDWLRDEFDIESRQDFAWMMDALRCVWRADKERWLKGSRADLNQLTRQARRLYERAKNYPCPPSVVVEWDGVQRRGLQANTIYKRPDGVVMWGSGELVFYDRNGDPQRPQDTIFGKKMPEGSVPFDFEMTELVDRAFPETEG